MKIFTLEGLPLVGKTTLGKNLCDYYNKKGINSVYRHAQITECDSARIAIEKGFKCLAKWDYFNNQPLFDFIKYRYQQIHLDYYEFQKNRDQFSEIEYLFLDRYITGHDVMAKVFGYEQPDICMNEFYELLSIEFLLVCDYQERKSRALLRQKSNNFTKYSVKDSATHTLLQESHCNYFNLQRCKIIFNNSFTAFDEIQKYMV